MTSARTSIVIAIVTALAFLSGCDKLVATDREETTRDAAEGDLVFDLDDDSRSDAPEDVVDDAMPADADDGGDEFDLELDPCSQIDGACAAPGRSCRGDLLVDCAEGTTGCLVETITACSADGGQCVGDELGAACVGGDPCLGRANPCDAESRRCDGDALVVCAPDALGCLVETTTECTATGNTCLAQAVPPVCSGGDRCQNLPNSCETIGRRCDGESLVECRTDASGCRVEEVTDCPSQGLQCRDGEGAIAACQTPCHDLACMTTAEDTYFCGGASTLVCRDESGDGCRQLGFVDSCAPDPCRLDPTTGVAGCPSDCPDATVLSCDDILFTGSTASGSTVFDAGGCTTDSHLGPEAVYEFRSPVAARVTIEALWSTPVDLDLLVYEAGNVCDDGVLTCVERSAERAVAATERVVFDASPDDGHLVVLDVLDPSPGTPGGVATYALRLSCTFATCGDGVAELGETCDDANADGGDGCSGTCRVEPGFACAGVPSTCAPTACGNGIVEGDETCDDANPQDRDGCEACALTDGWVCEGMPSQCRRVVCGDGVVDGPSESCDDGRDPPSDGDGCSRECTIEPGYACQGEPSACVVRVCGDGLVAPGEGCDDGDRVPGDGCDDRCEPEAGYFCSGEPSFCSLSEGDECSDAIPLPFANATYGFDTTSASDAVSFWTGGCAAQLVVTEGRDRVFEIDVPPGGDLAVTVSAPGHDSITILAQDCNGDDCLKIDDRAPGMAETVSASNPGATTATYLVLVDGPGASDNGPFSLTVSATPP